MKMPKAIFIDLDGTLLSNIDKQVPKSAAAALARARAAGILLFVATGRHRNEFVRIAGLNALSLDGFVTLNGAYCYIEDKVIYKNPLARGAVQKMVQRLAHAPFPCIFSEETEIYINMVNGHVEDLQKQLNVAAPTICEPARALAPGAEIFQLSAFCDDQEKEDFLRGLPHSKITRWMTGGVDVVNESVNKWDGIIYMLRHFGIAPEHSAAIGDAENDMEMLLNAGFSVAMGNADEDVKKCAKFVTSHVDEDGLARAIDCLMAGGAA